MIRFTTALLISAAAALPARAEVDIQTVTSPGGIEAWLVEEHSLPFVAVEIAFVGGTSLDVEGKRGAVNLMTGLLEEGSGDLDARGFARAKEELATSFGFSANSEQLTISARFLRRCSRVLRLMPRIRTRSRPRPSPLWHMVNTPTVRWIPAPPRVWRL